MDAKKHIATDSKKPQQKRRKTTKKYEK